MAEETNATGQGSCGSCGGPGGSSCGGRFWIVLVLLIAVGAIVYWQVSDKSTTTGPAPQPGAPGAPVASEAGAPGATTEVPWGHDYEAALAKAKETGKPILMVFHATWCGPCRQMKATTYKDAAVVAKAESFVPVYVDVDEKKALSDQFEIRGIPHYVIVSPQGQEVERFGGSMAPHKFIAGLDRALGKVKAAGA